MALLSADSLSASSLNPVHRWEMGSLDSGGGNNSSQSPHRETEESRRAALAQGFEQGYAEGLKQGQADGERMVRVETQQRADGQINEIRQLVVGTEQAVFQLQEKVGQQVLNLAIELTRQILNQEITQNPQAILAIVRDAIAQISNHEKPAQLQVHPQDAETIRQFMNDELGFAGCRIVEDLRIARGGCKIVSNSGEIDAQIETRWKRVLATITGSVEKVPELQQAELAQDDDLQDDKAAS